MSELVVVIPSFNDEKPLLRCLESLQSLETAGLEFSRDNIIIENSDPPKKRRYFTEAINDGLVKARKLCKSPKSMIWLLNSDCVVDLFAATGAWKCFNEEGWDKVGIVGSKCIKANNPDHIVFGGAMQCYPGGRHKSGLVSEGACNIRTEEEWLTFASVFINPALVDEIGLLDKNLEHICSDSDYCYRARYAGWKCFYEPTSIVKHEVGSSHHSTDMVLNQVKSRDIERFKRKWITGLFQHLSSYDVKGNKV